MNFLVCKDCTHNAVCGLKESFKAISEKLDETAKDIDSGFFQVSLTCKHYSSFKVTTTTGAETAWSNCKDLNSTSSKLTEEWVDTTELKSGVDR